MAKSRRSKKTKRGTRKQKGGMQISLKGQNSKKTIRMNVNNSTTPRNLLKKYMNQTTINSSIFSSNKPNPAWKIILPGQKRKEFDTVWNTPWKELAEKGNIPPLQNTGDYILLPSPQKSEELCYEQDKEIMNSMNIFRKLILSDLMSSAKIILLSAAIESNNYSKNVKQQFMFPSNNNILIDWDFFTGRTYDFYKYLKFEKKLIPKIGPENSIRIYVKPAGKPLEIETDTIEDANEQTNITLEDKQKYLNEVVSQAKDFDLTANEIRICCFKHNLKYDMNDRDSSCSIKHMLRQLGKNYSIYDFQGKQLYP